jgi:integrase
VRLYKVHAAPVSTPVTPAKLEAFRAWIIARGRTEGTAALYVKNVRAAGKQTPITKRLQEDLAPLTLRTNKAALAAWAKYTKDTELAEILSDIKLPPARRQAVKIPLATEDWRELGKRFRDNPGKVKSVDAAVALIILRRGLRIGDALRIQRSEVIEALTSGTLSYVGKGGKRHEISAKAIRSQLEVLAAQGNWKRVSDLVCPKATNPTSPHNRVRRAIERTAKACKLRGVHPHRFRRTYATVFLSRHEGDPQALMKLQQHMGWASLQTAAGYADAVNREQLADVGDKMVEDVLE